MPTIGQRLKEARKRKKLSQVELGKLLDVSGVAINRYEKGLRNPDPEMLIKLADLLDISTDYLLKGKNYDPENYDWVLGWFNSLPLEIQVFLSKEDSLEWLKIAHKMEKNKISTNSAEILANAFIEAFSDTREESKKFTIRKRTEEYLKMKRKTDKEARILNFKIK